MDIAHQEYLLLFLALGRMGWESDIDKWLSTEIVNTQQINRMLAT